MSWKDIIKAKTHAKGGGTKGDRPKVHSKPEQGRLDELGQDIKARKHGKEAEDWEAQLREEGYGDRDPWIDDETYDSWISREKPTGTRRMVDDPDINVGEQFAIGKNKLTDLAKEINNKLVSKLTSLGYISEELKPGQSNDELVRELNEDRFSSRTQIGQWGGALFDDETFQQFVGRFNRELLTTNYDFEPKHDITFFFKEMPYDIKRSTSKYKGQSHRDARGYTELTTERFLPKRSSKEKEYDERRRKIRAQSESDPGKIYLLLACQFYVEWVNDNWTLTCNLFKFSTAFEKDRITEGRLSEVQDILAPSDKTDQEKEKQMKGHYERFLVPEFNLSNHGKKERIEIDKLEEANSALSKIKSFFSYYLRL